MLELQSIGIKQRNGVCKFKPSKETNELLLAANLALARICESEHLTLTEINQLIYAAAVVVSGEIQPKPARKSVSSEGPKWKMRLKNRISLLRKDISVLEQIKKLGVAGKALHRKADNIKNRHAVNDITELTRTLKMKLQAKAQRLRIFTERSEQYHQNKKFRDNTKNFYRDLNGKQAPISETPTQKEIQKGKRGLLEKYSRRWKIS